MKSRAPCSKWTEDVKKEIQGDATGWCTDGGFKCWTNCDGNPARCDADEPTESMQAALKLMKGLSDAE